MAQVVIRDSRYKKNPGFDEPGKSAFDNNVYLAFKIVKMFLHVVAGSDKAGGLV